MKTYAKYLAGAVALAAAGFLLAVGVMSVLFKAKTGAFAPSTSADAASWVQAIGSIAAILSAYHLGARRAAQDKRQAEIHAFEKANRQEAILTLIEATCDRVLHTAQMITGFEPGHEWRIVLPLGMSETSAGLDTLRGIPHAEFNPPDRVKHLSEIRAALETLLAQQRTCAEVIERNRISTTAKDHFALEKEKRESHVNVVEACEKLRAHTQYVASVITMERKQIRAATPTMQSEAVNG